jgi:hypothetical protein
MSRRHRPSTAVLVIVLASASTACHESQDLRPFAETSAAGEGDSETGDPTISGPGDESGPTETSDGEPDPTGDPDGGGPSPDAGASDEGGDGQPDISPCSNFAEVGELFDWINEQRGAYAGEGPYLPHSRYKGIPWQGEGHEIYTFATRFSWDDALAGSALEEAQRLADGGVPAGVQVAGQNGQNRDFWVDGLNTKDWRITAPEYPGDWEGTYAPSALHISNGSVRMGLYYHDFGGDGPAITRLGMAAVIADPNACALWWVLQFGE